MLTLFSFALFAGLTAALPTVTDSRSNLTYQGFSRNGIDVFLNIQYGEDTGGQNRFKPPILHIPKPGTTINATFYGPACPQPLNSNTPPLTLTNITNVSENCLNLNIARPNNTDAASRLPVMVWIHGGRQQLLHGIITLTTYRKLLDWFKPGDHLRSRWLDHSVD